MFSHAWYLCSRFCFSFFRYQFFCFAYAAEKLSPCSQFYDSHLVSVFCTTNGMCFINMFPGNIFVYLCLFRDGRYITFNSSSLFASSFSGFWRPVTIMQQDIIIIIVIIVIIIIIIIIIIIFIIIIIIIIIIINRFYLTHPLYVVLRSNVIFTQLSDTFM